ncbi:MAG TPA: hypothetical protein VGZ90_01305, partial [Puia sp.]|nr:hypothetical protein [Puia sp.]
MPDINFYLKPPVVYTCVKHPQILQWLPGECWVQGCKEERLTIRENPNKIKDLPIPGGNPPAQLVYLQMRYHGQKFVYSMKFNVEQ